MDTFEFSKLNLKKIRKIIDVGCGNGWVVRKLAAHPDCTSASGVDGAVTMIQKARDIDPGGNYHLAMIPQWIPDSKVDLIHSMEFMYYLEDPFSFICTIYDKEVS